MPELGFPFGSAVGPARARQGDGLAVVGHGQALSFRDFSDQGQADQPALRLAAQQVLVARVGGKGDFVVVAAGGQFFQR